MVHAAMQILVLEFISLSTPFHSQFSILSRMVDGRVLTPDRPTCWHGLRHVLPATTFRSPGHNLRDQAAFLSWSSPCSPATRVQTAHSYVCDQSCLAGAGQAVLPAAGLNLAQPVTLLRDDRLVYPRRVVMAGGACNTRRGRPDHSDIHSRIGRALSAQWPFPFRDNLVHDALEPLTARCPELLLTHIDHLRPNRHQTTTG